MKIFINVLFWILLAVFIVSLFLNDLAILQVGCVIGIIIIRVYIVESEQRDCYKK